MRSGYMSASLLIISHNSADCVDACLRAACGTDCRVIVIDNASTDGTLPAVRRAGSGIRFLANPQNVGFAAAVNQGLRSADTETVVILNPDVLVTRSSLDNLMRAFADPRVGAAGGKLVHADASTDAGFTVRRFPTLASMLAEVLLLNRLWHGNPWNRRYRCLNMDYAKEQEVDQPAGACLAVRRAAFDDIGGFDENFFPVWFEDVDFCRRLQDRGWKILYRPDAVFTHAGGHSVSKLSFLDRQAFWYTNLLRYFAKHHAAWQLFSLRVGILFGLLLRSLLSLTGLRPAGVSVRQALSAYWHVAWNFAIRHDSGRDEAERRRALQPGT